MTEKKEYIEREALVQRLAVSPLLSQMRASCFLKEGVLDIIQKFPAADVVEVVRCKDCKHWRYKTVERIEHYECNIFCGAYGRGYPTDADDFCSYGERKDE